MYVRQTLKVLKDMSSTNSLKKVLCAVALPLLVLLPGCMEKKAKVEVVVEPLRPGVVDMTKVLKNHGDWDRLDRLDKKLEEIQKRMGETSGKSLQELGADQAKRMAEAHKKAQAELQAELKSVEASLERQKADTQRQFQKAIEDARANAGRLAAAKPSQSAAALTGDMVMLRDRQLSSRRLALQKKATENINREKDRLDAELFAYENQISKENQQQRLNIQLKLQLEGSEEDKKALQDELSAITEEESRLKNAKKAEIGEQLRALSDREFANVEREVEAYKAQLNKDIMKQVGGVSDSSLQDKARQIESSLASKQKSLEAEMASAGAEANRRLNAKKAEIEKRLANLEKSLRKEMEQSREMLIASDMEKLEQLKKEYASVESDRSKLYDSMVSDVEKIVLRISGEKGVNAVFLTYVSNISAVDLTESVADALKKEKK